MADYRMLLNTALVWAEKLALRPGVAGIFLYGSLTKGEQAIHEFSDVDVALVMDDEHLPAHYVEHRLLDSVKTDTTFIAASTITGWLEKPPARLFEGHWTNGLFLRALAEGDESTILFDPLGSLHRVQALLPTYEALVLPEVLRWLADFRTNKLEKDVPDSGDLYGHLHPGWVSGIVTYWADEKSLPMAAEKLGLPRVAEALVRWQELLEFPATHLEQVCETQMNLGEFTQAEFYSRLSVPGSLELVGDWGLFWPGNRIHTMERLQAELPLTLRWCESLRQQGKLAEARYMLWPCDPAGIRQRVAGLRDALIPLGYDITAFTETFLSSPELAELEAAFTDCIEEGKNRRIPDQTVAEVRDLARWIVTQLETRAQI